jgi:hypothetical protein
MENDSDYETSGPSGVGGWLLLLCVGLTVFGPILGLYNISSGYKDASPYFDVVPGVKTLFMIDVPLSLGLVMFSLFAGAGLWGVRPGAVRTAKRYLLCLLGYSLVTLMLPYIVNMPKEMTKLVVPELIKGTFKTAIYVGVWYAYLSNSQRVRNTYRS